MKITVSQIFKTRPEKWGLRGDIYLWDDFENYFSNITIPCLPEDFLDKFYIMFEKLTCHSISSSENIFVELYDHGGMSGGDVCPEFWRNKAIPMLIERLKKLNEEYIK